LHSIVMGDDDGRHHRGDGAPSPPAAAEPPPPPPLRNLSATAAGAAAAPAAAAASAVPVEDLPGDHLFRLVYRDVDRIGNDPDGPFVVVPEWQRDPVDWDLVTARLDVGDEDSDDDDDADVNDRDGRRWRQRRCREELAQWVDTGTHGPRLFLHQLCMFDFRPDGGRFRDRWEPFGLDGAKGLRLIEKAIAAYPEAVRTPQGDGCYPLHVGGSRRINHYADLFWRRCVEDIFNVVFRSAPEVATKRSLDGSFPLHSLLSVSMRSGDVGRASYLRAVRTLLDANPDAVRIPDYVGSFPMHRACRHASYCHDVLKLLVGKFPQALYVCSPGLMNGSPLHVFLRKAASYSNTVEEQTYRTGRMLAEACPFSAFLNDGGFIKNGTQEGLEPAGDALDFASVVYCKKVGMDFSWEDVSKSEFVVEDDSLDDDGWRRVRFRRGYVHCNIEFLRTTEEERKRVQTKEEVVDCEVQWSMELLLAILRVMSGRENFMPLHAAVTGRCCRPWNLAVMEGMLAGYDAGEPDPDGNLPLHLFLESCLLERERAQQNGYAYDGDDYDAAVAGCFGLLLDAHPGAAKVVNGEGKLPLHLAIENLSHLPTGSVLVPLLDAAPRTIAVRDAVHGLFPFAAAAVGMPSRLDAVYALLRRDPGCLRKQVIPVPKIAGGVAANVGDRKRKLDPCPHVHLYYDHHVKPVD